MLQNARMALSIKKRICHACAAQPLPSFSARMGHITSIISFLTVTPPVLTACHCHFYQGHALLHYQPAVTAQHKDRSRPAERSAASRRAQFASPSFGFWTTAAAAAGPSQQQAQSTLHHAAPSQAAQPADAAARISVTLPVERPSSRGLTATVQHATLEGGNTPGMEALTEQAHESLPRQQQQQPSTAISAKVPTSASSGLANSLSQGVQAADPPKDMDRAAAAKDDKLQENVPSWPLGSAPTPALQSQVATAPAGHATGEQMPGSQPELPQKAKHKPGMFKRAFNSMMPSSKQGRSDKASSGEDLQSGRRHCADAISLHCQSADCTCEGWAYYACNVLSC